MNPNPSNSYSTTIPMSISNSKLKSYNEIENIEQKEESNPYSNNFQIFLFYKMNMLQTFEKKEFNKISDFFIDYHY
jgi:hypothetical protein